MRSLPFSALVLQRFQFSPSKPQNVTPKAIILALNMHQILCRLWIRGKQSEIRGNGHVSQRLGLLATGLFSIAKKCTDSRERGTLVFDANNHEVHTDTST